jgi:SOS-response transcriptional repressor LexA
MPAVATHAARFALLLVELPGAEPVHAGVLLEDRNTNRIYVRMRHDWDLLAPEESEVLSALESDLLEKAREMGAAQLLDWLTNTLSNTLQIGEPREVMVEGFERALGRLYREHVAATVQPFTTHLPRFSLAVAAGKFLENQEVSEEGWEEVPQALRLTPDMFVARIMGRSMEPRIPDGSLCIFRAGVTGSRQGRLVLVEYLGGGTNDRYTVKRYRSEKRPAPGGAWEHESIRLEPLNPEFEAWDLDPEEGRFHIVAEFVDVLA